LCPKGELVATSGGEARQVLLDVASATNSHPVAEGRIFFLLDSRLFLAFVAPHSSPVSGGSRRRIPLLLPPAR
jgi:hypothetical protein